MLGKYIIDILLIFKIPSLLRTMVAYLTSHTFAESNSLIVSYSLPRRLDIHHVAIDNQALNSSTDRRWDDVLDH